MHIFIMVTKTLYLSIAVLLLSIANSNAQHIHPATAGNTSHSTLRIYSSLDHLAAIPLIKAFQEQSRNITVHYYDLQSLEIYEKVIQETKNNQPTADIVVSSAMDLQMKLANDGYTKAVQVGNAERWPGWAKWRSSAFALTLEPAVFVYHKPTFKNIDVPKTRDELTKLLKAKKRKFYGRIATYDIERAGLGFLFLARDAEHNKTIWNMVSSFGATGVKLYSNSSAILERVADGRFFIGYNILGSYARAWAEHNPDLGIVSPSDYTVVMSRIALIPKAAHSPELGQKFLDFLMSEEGQKIMAVDSRISPLHPKVRKENTAQQLKNLEEVTLRPIPVSPALLVYLDQVKRARFLEKWNASLRDSK